MVELAASHAMPLWLAFLAASSANPDGTPADGGVAVERCVVSTLGLRLLVHLHAAIELHFLESEANPAAARDSEEELKLAAPMEHQVGWSYGMDAAVLVDLVRYWRDTYDWRLHEARLNALGLHKATVDGIDIVFHHPTIHSCASLRFFSVFFVFFI